ncbi:MFS transporter [Simkania negevensis]|uniref:MFS transporter n=1 Tax=Simkania negevensis TaxID=83561 RepID=A0ABS3AR01_9BACT|nr:MFS transporter [Simkania negevensis]
MRKGVAKVIVLSSMGGAIEFYDFTIYLFLSSELKSLFFPSSDRFVSLLGVLLMFALGYLVRPIGGVLFGHFGDRYGRKKVFTASVMFMAISTFLIGLLPTFSTAGIYSVIMLVILRLIQGLSLGGEIPGALTFVGEYVKKEIRGLTCAIVFASLISGMVIGSIFVLLLEYCLDHEQMLAYGWRIPFLCGGLAGMISFVMRKKLSETVIFQTFEQEAEAHRMPIFNVFTKHFKGLIASVLLVWLVASVVTLLYIFMPTYLINYLNYPEKHVDTLNTINIIIFALLIVPAGWMSDRLGRRPVIFFGALGLFVFGFPLFLLLGIGSLFWLGVSMFVFSIFCSAIAGAFSSALVEQFATESRYSGVAVAYNISFAIFGGLTPLIAILLVRYTTIIASPSFYLMLSGLAAVIGCSLMRVRHRASLN